MRICCATTSVWPDGSPCCTRGLAGARLRPSAGRLARRHEDASLAANVAQPGLTHPLDLSISDPLRRATTEGVLPMEMAHLMTDTVFYSIPNADRVMYVHHAVMFYCHMAMGSVAGTRCFGLDDGPPGIDGVRLLSLAGFVAEVPGPFMAFRWVMMKKGWHVRFPVWFFVNNGVMLVGWIGSRIVWFFYVFWFMLLPVKDAYISAGAGDVSVPPPRHLQRHRACGCAVVQWGLAGGDRHEAASQWSFAAVPSPYQARTKPLLPRPLPFPNALFPRSLLALQIWWTMAGGYGVICALSIGWVRLLLKAGLRDYLIHNPNAKSTLRTIHKAEGEDDLKQD